MFNPRYYSRKDHTTSHEFPCTSTCSVASLVSRSMGRVIIDGRPLAIENASGSHVQVQLTVNRWHRFTRNKEENDTAMEIRVQRKVDQLRQVCAARLPPHLARARTPLTHALGTAYRVSLVGLLL